MNSKRHLKSVVFYEDRHVHCVELHENDPGCSHTFVRCKVLPSFPTSDKKTSPEYDVWILMSKVTGSIHSAECSCPAGQGEACNHIAALLYAVADISEQNRDGNLAPTSMKCKWNNPRKRKLSPKKSQDIKFRKCVFGRETCEYDRERKSEKIPTITNFIPKTDIHRFRNKLVKNGSKAGWLKNFPPANSEHNWSPKLPVLHHINFNYHDSKNIDDLDCKNTFVEYFQSLHVSSSDCQIIECLTRGQSKCSDWFKARQERITSSNFGSVFKRKEETPPETILQTLLGYKTVPKNKYTNWGLKHEPAARRTYFNIMKKKHPCITVKPSGLIVNPKYPHLGTSPDGCVHCGHCKSDSSGLLEIKCPSSDNWKFLTPEDCAKDPKFYCYLNENDEPILKRNHDYYFQVQGEMALFEKTWCDFVVWTATGKISIERIKFDQDCWIKTLQKLNKFYVNNIIPELFTQRVRRGIKLR